MRHPLLQSLALVLVLTGCGRDAAVAPLTQEKSRPVQGAIVKGPLAGATVNFFHIDDAGQATGALVATVVSDAEGHVSVSLPPGTGSLLAVSSGGSYVDESDDAGGDNRRRITLAENEGFETIVPANATSFAMTPYSMALLLRARDIANGANFAAVYPAVISQAIGIFGFDPTSVIPDDPLAPDLSTPDAAKYGLLLGGAAYAINAIATAHGVLPSYQTIIAFIEDLSDGILDGTVNGSAVQFKSVQIGGTTVSLNDETLRFRNNHYDLYQNLTASVNETSWSDTPPDLPPDLPPVARGDSATVDRGHSISVLDSGELSVLANDSNTGGGGLTAVLETPPVHGSVTLHPDGTFTYQNDGSVFRVDSFTYTAHTPNATSAPATVHIAIIAPGGCQGGGDLVACDDHYTIACNQILDVPSESPPVPPIWENDTIPRGESEVIFEKRSDPDFGFLESFDQFNGSFEYIPNCGCGGGNTGKSATNMSTSFSYRLDYGDLVSNTATIKITVTPPTQPSGQATCSD